MNNRESGQAYLKIVRSYLPCSRRVKNQIMEQITKNLDAYLSEEPEAEYAQIVARFGEPEAIAAAYVESTGTAEILRALQIRRRIVSIVAAIMAVVLISWAGVITWAVVREAQSEPGIVETGAAGDNNSLSVSSS